MRSTRPRRVRGRRVRPKTRGLVAARTVRPREALPTAARPTRRRALSRAPQRPRARAGGNRRARRASRRPGRSSARRSPSCRPIPYESRREVRNRMARVTLLSPTWRLVTATLVAVSWLTLPTYALAIFLLPPVPPVVMVRSFVLGTALPWLMAWAIARGFAGSVAVRDGVLRLCRSDLELEIPCAAITALRPWRISLPRPGLSLRVRAGERVPLGVAVDHPAELLDALAGCGIDTS